MNLRYALTLFMLCTMTISNVYSMEWLKNTVANVISYWRIRNEIKAFENLAALSTQNTVDPDEAYILTQQATSPFQKKDEAKNSAWTYPSFDNFIEKATQTVHKWNNFVKKNPEAFKYAAPYDNHGHKRILKSLNKDNIDTIMTRFEEDYKKRLPNGAEKFQGESRHCILYPEGFEFTYSKNAHIHVNSHSYTTNLMYQKRVYFEKKYNHLKELGDLLEKIDKKKQI